MRSRPDRPRRRPADRSGRSWHAFTDGAVAHGWIGRQLPRPFRQAGLAEVSAIPVMVLTRLEFFQMMSGNHVCRLCADGTRTSRQAARWRSQLARRADSGDFLAAVLFFLAATRP